MMSLYHMTQDAFAKCFRSTFVELLSGPVSFAKKRDLASAQCVSLSTHLITRWGWREHADWSNSGYWLVAAPSAADEKL